MDKNEHKYLIPTSCSFLAIRICSDRQNTSLYHRTKAQKQGLAYTYIFMIVLYVKGTATPMIVVTDCIWVEKPLSTCELYLV